MNSNIIINITNLIDTQLTIKPIMLKNKRGIEDKAIIFKFFEYTLSLLSIIFLVKVVIQTNNNKKVKLKIIFTMELVKNISLSVIKPKEIELIINNK